ncbi:inactive rhomboid-related protein 2-like [Panulirus ornatus]|uniref:inactive rhomboid-related protein 2-like n=1 Tax=Panulirus ornatus TaxID=150431 RepID=UPI003A851D79
MENSWEEIPLHPLRQMNPAQTDATGRGSCEWKDVWYRLEEGRGRINLEGFEERIIRSTNNAQAIPQALKLLREVDKQQKGYVDYAEFQHYYNTVLPDSSWERGVLMRVSLDVRDLTPTPEEEPLCRVWMALVDYVHNHPSKEDFNWEWITPADYKRSRLLHFVFYKSELVHPRRLREWLMTTKEVDNLPNQAVINLLEKCRGAFRDADVNRDGYVEYEEFLRFVRMKSAVFRGSAALRRGALAVLPRRERTLETRRYIEEYSCCPPPLFMILITVAEIATFIFYVVDMKLPITGSGPCPTYSPLVFNPRRRYEAWRFLSYALIHSGWVHLVNNLLVQTLLGLLLEMVHMWRVIIVYMVGVLAGSLAHSLYTPTFFLAGASGGVYAVEYAHLGNLILNWSEMEMPWLQLLMIMFIMGLDLGYAVWDTYTNPETTTGHMAHLGGAVAGVLVGLVALKNLREVKWEGYCWWASLTLLLVLVASAIFLNAFLPIPQFFPENDWSSIADNRDEWLLHNRELLDAEI